MCFLRNENSYSEKHFEPEFQAASGIVENCDLVDTKKQMLWILLGLLVACALCSWLLPDSSLARSAARALDTSVLLLSQDSVSDELPQPRHGVTPFQAKRIAAAQDWRCACGCVDPRDPQRRGYLLDASYEIDHKIPLTAGGSNDESNLQALLRTHHQAKSSAFARGVALRAARSA